ncbi:MAG: YggS family pyridoxal phosphate-dependent enzyme [Chloroflexi bacterium]|nr:YggS family pyridoxal phosphate-dependent enzyme [Chloroflexota bacterium]MCC6896987.1 YggS family pyridoxal phosphate-dependent enzyme [Anaerolineae bacterium]
MTITENIQAVRQSIADACARVGRDPQTVTLIAVSKTSPVEAIIEAAAAGVQHFGENRVEEAEWKIPAVAAQRSTGVNWHMIGHIQSRKAKDVAPLFQVIHSVDTFKLAQKFSALGVERQAPLEILLEVNVSGEEAKHGFAAANWSSDSAVKDALWEQLIQLVALPGLRLRGLMTMAPIVEDAEQARPVFASLAALRQAIQESFKITLPDLSMGMTDDYPVAIEEGATLVRVGRAIFGERNK